MKSATTGPTSGKPGADGLTERERRFVTFYMGEAAGNATKAARLAGYSAKTARKQGSRLLRTKGHIRAAIDQAAKDDPAVWTREDRQRFWTAIAAGTDGFGNAELRDRLKASELLGRSQADFVDRHEVDAGASLVDVIAAIAAGQERGR